MPQTHGVSTARLQAIDESIAEAERLCDEAEARWREALEGADKFEFELVGALALRDLRRIQRKVALRNKP